MGGALLKGSSPRGTWRRAAGEILAWFFPSPCACCGKPGITSVCGQCLEQLSAIRAPFCLTCGREIPSHLEPGITCLDCRDVRILFDAARSLFHYSGPAGVMVKAAKYRKIWSLTDVMARLMADYLLGGLEPHGIPLNRVDAVVPVAIHPETMRRRGFNQSELVAEKLARLLGLPSRNWLKKVRRTAPQAGLGDVERRKNLNKAYSCDPELCMGKNVLVIDDVYTTGATANECARALKSAGAREVRVLTFARGGFDDQGL